MKKEYISDLMLERYLLKELPEKQIVYIDTLCKQMPELQDRINALNSSSSDILEEYPADFIVPQISRKYESAYAESDRKSSLFKNKFRKLIIIPSFALATAIISLLFIIPVVRTSLNYVPVDDSQYGARIKGTESKIYIYRKINDEVEILNNNSKAKHGDLLQIAYVSMKDEYGIILSIDSRGTTTLHFPSDMVSSTKLESGEKTLLSNSYELDDAPEFEKFYFITSDHELDVISVLQAAQLMANDRQNVLTGNGLIIKEDKTINQTSVLIKKVK
ncbi:MAG: hypothetical protein JW864_11435 [Spirochaetes bacterium]|nr:hypothetical protein [Spirochaetota bacterium]